MNTHTVPSGDFPWDTPGGRLGRFFPSHREDLYPLVALRVVGGGATIARATRFPKRTRPPGTTLRLPTLGVKCHPKTTKAAPGLCPRLPPSALDGSGPLEDVPPYAPREPCLEGPWALRPGGNTDGRNNLACYLRGNCRSLVAQSALEPLGKDLTERPPPWFGLSPPR